MYICTSMSTMYCIKYVQLFPISATASNKYHRFRSNYTYRVEVRNFKIIASIQRYIMT